MDKNSQFVKTATEAGQNKRARRKYYSELMNEQAENLRAGWKQI
jgi:hypothetical protein